jgi:hypothetical protein
MNSTEQIEVSAFCSIPVYISEFCSLLSKSLMSLSFPFSRYCINEIFELPLRGIVQAELKDYP